MILFLIFVLFQIWKIPGVKFFKPLHLSGQGDASQFQLLLDDKIRLELQHFLNQKFIFQRYQKFYLVMTFQMLGQQSFSSLLIFSTNLVSTTCQTLYCPSLQQLRPLDYTSYQSSKTHWA
jgi:hypothetical protein